MKKSNLTAIYSVLIITFFLITGTAFGTDALKVDSSGNVGIGVEPSSNYKLYVYGSSGTYPARVGNSNGYLIFGPGNSTYSHFYTDRSYYYFNRGVIVDSGLIGSYNEDLSLRTSGTTRMTISNSTGRVGIGTTSPDGALHVAQSANSNLWLGGTESSDDGDLVIRAANSDTYTILFSGGSGTNSYINTGGNIGIGTTSPDAIFNVQGGTDVAPSISYPGFIVAGDLQSYNIGIDNNEIMARYNGATSSLYIQNEGGNTILNTYGGNVGIGTSSPSYGLYVYEDDTGAAIYARNDRASGLSVALQGLAYGGGSNYGIYTYAYGGTSNYAAYFNGYVYGTGTASFAKVVDRTPFYEGDALSEIAKISGKDGEIDHSTLPDFAYVTHEVPVFEESELIEISPYDAFETVIVEQDKVVETTNDEGDIEISRIQKGVKTESRGYKVEDGKIIEIVEETPFYETELIETTQLRNDVYFDELTGKVYQKTGDGEIFEKGGKIYQRNQTGIEIEEQRDLGAMISMLTVAVQQLNQENEKLRQRISILESRSK